MSASDWKGYFIRDVENEKNFPMKYIKESSYQSTPNQREEIKAYRNENTRNLTRVTATGKKTSISFTTRPNLTLSDKIKIQKFFTDAESNHSQRKVKLKYWNDEDNEYHISNFYRPDIEFRIKKATSTDLIYDEITIELVEY